MKKPISFAFALIGGFAFYYVFLRSSLDSGNCSISAVITGLMFGVPVGSGIGVLLFRLFSRQFKKNDIISLIISMIISAVIAIVGVLIFIETMGPRYGIYMTIIFVSCCTYLSFEKIEPGVNKIAKAINK